MPLRKDLVSRRPSKQAITHHDGGRLVVFIHCLLVTAQDTLPDDGEIIAMPMFVGMDGCFSGMRLLVM